MSKLFLFLIRLTITFLLVPIVTWAQTLDPSSWQSNATGLATQSRTDKKTAGLGFIIEQRAWPFLYAMGGAIVKSGKLGESFTGIELGQMQAGGAGGFVSEETDWAHNTLTFNGLTLYTSRLSSAVVVESQASSIQLFTGTVNGFQYTSPTSVSTISRTSSLKFVASPAGSSAIVQALSSSDTLLNSPNWLLVWYGNNSHFVDTKIPSVYGSGYAIVPPVDGYQADIPLLITFENKPTSIKQGLNGGIELSFSGSSGHITVLPLFGKETLKVLETESWSGGLPQNIISKINFWKDRLCQFPYTVIEDYAYDAGTDTTTITENVTFLQTCTSSSIKFAPLPPLLAVVKDNLGIGFSKMPTDTNLPTEFGPLFGIDNPLNDTYSWSMTGLNKYVGAKRQSTQTGSPPPELVAELKSEAQKTITAGHYAPWIFIDMVKDVRGDIYWANPADYLYHLIEIAEALPEGQVKTDLIDYIQSERNVQGPEDVAHLNYSIDEKAETITCTPKCTSRGEYVFYGNVAGYAWANKSIVHKYARAFYKKVPLYNFYALSRYYALTQEAVPQTVVDKAKTVLHEDMQNHDWATMYWLDGYDQFYGHPEAVGITNRHLAGLIGLNRLVSNDPEATRIARGLLAKAAALRVAMATYPRYLYQKNLAGVPADPAWHVKYLAGNGIGEVYSYDWTDAFDDARQIHTLSQFDVLLSERLLIDYGGSASYDLAKRTYWIGMRDMVPELARLLSNTAKTDVNVYIDRYVTLFPHWYGAFMEAGLGAEHGQNHPVDSYQIFLGKAWIQNKPADYLRKHRDISWLTNGGDFFYMHKLAETIKAYQGWSWSDQGTSSCLGDVTQDQTRDLSDVIRCIRYLVGLDTLTSSELASADANQDGSVDLSDVIRIIRDLLGLEPLPVCQ